MSALIERPIPKWILILAIPVQRSHHVDVQEIEGVDGTSARDLGDLAVQLFSGAQVSLDFGGPQLSIVPNFWHKALQTSASSLRWNPVAWNRVVRIARDSLWFASRELLQVA